MPARFTVKGGLLGMVPLLVDHVRSACIPPGRCLAASCAFRKQCSAGSKQVGVSLSDWTFSLTQVSSTAEAEATTGQKLVKGHAYSVTGVEEVGRGDS